MSLVTTSNIEMTSAAQVLLNSIVWDNHGCMPVMRPHDTSFLPQLQRYRVAGLDAIMLNIGFGDMGIEEHIRTLASIRHWLKLRPNEYVLITSVEDVELAHKTGRLAVGFDIEGGNAIADQPSLVQLYYDLGVRWMLLAYNNNNRLGGGCQDDDDGLTSFGKEVIAEMERVGMIVCCSHTGHRTAREVLEVATKPVIFSHSNPSALHAHPRNIPDDLILGCAATGGVVGINGIGSFLGKNDNTSKTFARHIDHVHADLICALTNHEDGKSAVTEALGDGFAYVDWIRPGFQLSKLVGELKDYEGVVLAHHGLIVWDDDSDKCYEKN